MLTNSGKLMSTDTPTKIIMLPSSVLDLFLEIIVA
jgi:hypothetical protein